MRENKNVELLFDDIRAYIKNLETSLRNKEREIQVKDKRLEGLESREVNISKNIEDTDSISIKKSMLSIKSIYYLLVEAVKTKSTYEIKELFNILTKEELKTLSPKSNKVLVKALITYSVFSFDENDEKRWILAANLSKLNAEKLDGFEREVFNELIFEYKLYEFIDEDFLIRFIRKIAFTGGKDIAKSILSGMIDSQREITGQSNIQTMMLIGLYLKMERIRKVSYIEGLYITAMDSRFDNLFINFLIGKLNLDYSQIEDNFDKIKVLNRNLVIYIYDIASEIIKEEKVVEDKVIIPLSSSKPSLLSDVRKTTSENRKVDIKKIEKKDAITAIDLNKGTRICDIDGTSLKQINDVLAYYDGRGKLQGELKTNVLVCKKCRRKVINGDIIRKIYKELPINYRLKFKNKNDIGLSTFKYTISLPRGERFKLLKEVVCPALGVKNVIKIMEGMIDSANKQSGRETSLSVTEWEYDIEKIKETYKI